VAPLWVSYQANLGTLLRTCDAVGACMAVPRTPHYKEALNRGDTPLALLEPARERTVVLLGHEHQGVPDEAWELIDDVVQIPMIGRGSSLNVAVAGSLVLFRLAGLS